MPLKPILDSLEGLPDAIAEHYQSYSGNDSSLQGKYVLAVDSVDGWGLENTGALKRALAAEREAHRRYKGELGKYTNESGEPLDPGHVTEALDRLRRLEEGDLSADDKLKERLEATTRQLEDKYGKQVQKLSSERDSLHDRLKRTIVKNAALSAISKHEGRARALLPHVESAVDVRFNDDGTEELIVLDERRQPRVSPSQGSTGYMSVEEYVQELKGDPDFRGNFKGTDASGGGLDQPGPPGQPQHIDPKLPAVERLKIARQMQGGNSG